MFVLGGGRVGGRGGKSDKEAKSDDRQRGPHIADVQRGESENERNVTLAVFSWLMYGTTLVNRGSQGCHAAHL